MAKLRETLNPEEQQGAIEGPTRIKTERNKHPLRCRACCEMYYVDEGIYHEFRSAFDADPSENSFCCDDCEELEAEAAHSE